MQLLAWSFRQLISGIHQSGRESTCQNILNENFENKSKSNTSYLILYYLSFSHTVQRLVQALSGQDASNNGSMSDYSISSWPWNWRMWKNIVLWNLKFYHHLSYKAKSKYVTICVWFMISVCVKCGPLGQAYYVWSCSMK